MGRYREQIEQAEANAALYKVEMDKRIADDRAVWDRKAAPLETLLERLGELQDDLRPAGVAVEIVDKTKYPVEGQWNPSVAFCLKRADALSLQLETWFKVDWFDHRHRVTSAQTTGPDQGMVIEHRMSTLDDEEIDDLLRVAIEKFPWRE